jgi:hypothetical protein
MVYFGDNSNCVRTDEKHSFWIDSVIFTSGTKDGIGRTVNIYEDVNCQGNPTPIFDRSASRDCHDVNTGKNWRSTQVSLDLS